MTQKKGNLFSGPLELSVGTSVQLDLFRGKVGMTSVVSVHASNPFNHGGEIQEHRPEIARKALDVFGAKPHEVFYVEQAGQHYQEVPLVQNPNGEVDKDPSKRISLVTSAQLDAHLDGNTPPVGGRKPPPR